MHKPLGSLANIRVGHSFRTRIQNEAGGDIRILQIRDVKDDGAEIPLDSLPRMTWSGPTSPPLLKPGDVVLPSRGERYEAALITSDLPMLASGQLYILRPNRAGLTPEYLCWYLNQPQARNYILKNRAGTGIPTLSRPVLAALPVAVPSVTTQHKIVELQHLWQQEQTLSQQLLINRQKMLDGIFSKLVLK